MAQVTFATCAACVKVWDLPDEEPTSTFTPHRRNITCARWTTAGDTPVLVTSGDDGAVVFSSKAGAPLFTLSVSRGPEVRGFALVSSGGSKYLATGCSDATVRLWDLAQRTVVRSLAGHYDAITCVEAGNAGPDRYLATGDASGVLSLHNLAHTKVVRSITLPDERPVRCVAFDTARRGAVVGHVHGAGESTAPDAAAHVIAGSGGGLVAAWDVMGSPVPLWGYRAHTSSCNALALVPGTKLVATVGADRRLHLFDTVGHKSVKTLVIDTPLTSLDCHSDGHTIAVGTQSGSVIVYDLRSSTSPRTHMLRAHTPSAVACLQFMKERVAPKSALSPSSRLSQTAQRDIATGGSNSREQVIWNAVPVVDFPSGTAFEAGQNTAIRRCQGPTDDVEEGAVSAVALSRSAAGPICIPDTSRERHKAGYRTVVSSDLQAQLLKKLVEDAQYEFKQQVHSDIINLHVDMIRGFETLKEEVAQMLKQHLDAMQNLVQENARLREENSRLRNLY
eukprot:m51a1_g71 putative protein nedd1 isoform x1 (506) ;mRNA; f:231504-233826